MRGAVGVAAIGAILVAPALGCSNLLVTKGASVDGSTMIAYNADDGDLYGSLGVYPAADHAPDTMRDIWDWDTGRYLGQIPEANHTYNVIGNSNEFGLTIGETTFGGLSKYSNQPGAILDYGSLIWVTLQRAKTAREAIETIGNLLDAYGYASDGESFSISDQDDVFLMEIFSKGPGHKGAVWVATRIPDGYISGHANQCRTTTIDFDDAENVLFSSDVVTFAQDEGLYPKDGKREDFDFSAAYDPVSFTGARLCEARVFGIFTDCDVPGLDEYLNYAKGYDLSKRMPLYVKPSRKLSLNDSMWAMRTHFEGTWFDNSGLERPDVGAGAGNSVYRWRPLLWTSGGKKYVNERTVGVQQTGFNFVAHTRPNVPVAMATVTWWAPDDSSMALRVPMYAAAGQVSAAFADPVGIMPHGAAPYGNPGSAVTMSLDSAFWVWNLVSNYAMDRGYATVYPDIQQKLAELEGAYMAQVADADVGVRAALSSGDAAKAKELMTNFTITAGDDGLTNWRDFWMHLFSRYRDGFTNKAPVLPMCADGKTENCTFREIPDSEETGYTDSWYARIVADSDNAEVCRRRSSSSHNRPQLSRALWL